jgi:succinate dehydrogenase / fumarate reductase membrane anchor subunit
MEREVADRNNREGMMGWLNPRRYGWERVSYWLQRLTGVGLLAYFIAHIYETSQIAGGPALWEAFLELTQTTLGHVILIVVIGMCVYHSANGIRLIFAHGGKGQSQCYMGHLCSLEANNEKMTMLRESQIMKIHYITGVAAIFVVAVHIMMRIAIMPYGMSLEYENVIANYQNIPYIVLLESILVLVSIHGFNGLRVILLELRQSKKWEDGVTILTIAAMIALIAYGTRTIILANGLGVE